LKAVVHKIPFGAKLDNLRRNLEIVGGISVVVSLLIVAYEIRQNTTALQATAMQESTTILREQVMILATNPELSRLMASDFEQLSPDDQQRVKWSSRSFWFGYQGQFRQWRIGLLPDDEWRTWFNIICINYKSTTGEAATGGSQLWPFVNHLLMPDFVDFVEGNCVDPDS
jgi:hypothetical protein